MVYLVGGQADSFLSALFGRLGTGYVYLFGPFGGIGENYHLITSHFEEPAADEYGLLLNTFSYHQFAGLKHGHNRGMHGEDGKLSLDAGRYHHVYLIGEDYPLRSYNFEL